jgi:hypothetical protein
MLAGLTHRTDMTKPLIASLVVLAACDSQVDSNHQGEALVALKGSVTDQRSQPAAVPAEIAVVYTVDGPSYDFAAGERVTVSSQFPAQFEIDIFEPPAPGLLNTFEGGQRVAIGLVMAVKPGTQLDSEEALAGGFLGLDPNHMLVYFENPVVAGSRLSDLFHGPADAGFHIFDVKRLTEAEIAARKACEESLTENGAPESEIYAQCGGHWYWDDLVLAPAGTSLEVDLVDGIESVDFPNWT